MENRVAMLAIVVENIESAEKVNEILHNYSEYIIGRTGLPYRKRGISLISVVLDAPEEVIGAVSGKLGMISDVSSKAVFAKLK